MLDEIVIPLLEWYEENKRDLPWRQDPTPYHVWVSEIMLQQTRVEAVKGYYHRFLEELSTVEDLACCEETRLLKLWEGLGYYNRVKNMQKAAIYVTEHYQGEIPRDYHKILALPGIGSYTAGAISSIAYGMKRPAVDGNVLRVYSRITEDKEDILKQSMKRRVEEELSAVMPEDRPGAFNQALMELGATVCIPNGAAKCSECPLAGLCLAHRHDTVQEYPKKKAKKERRVEEKTILLIQNGGEYAIHKRPGRGLLAGLYEFPNRSGFLSEEEALQAVRELQLMPLYIRRAEDAKHIFSHVEWHMKGYVIRVAATDDGESKSGSLIFVDKKESEGKYPIPSAFSAYRKYIEEDYES